MTAALVASGFHGPQAVAAVLFYRIVNSKFILRRYGSCTGRSTSVHPFARKRLNRVWRAREPIPVSVLSCDPHSHSRQSPVFGERHHTWVFAIVSGFPKASCGGNPYVPFRSGSGLKPQGLRERIFGAMRGPYLHLLPTGLHLIRVARSDRDPRNIRVAER